MAFANSPAYNNAPTAQRALAQGRLSLVSDDPRPSLDKTAKSVLYYVPDGGNQIGLYVDSQWAVYSFVLASLGAAGLSASKLYDIFACYLYGGVLLEASAWRGSGQAITGVTRGNPAIVSATAHGLHSGDTVYVSGLVGCASANGTFQIKWVNANSFELVGCDTSADSAYSADGWFTARALQYGKDINSASLTMPIVINSTAHGLSTGASVTVQHVEYSSASSPSVSPSVSPSFSVSASTSPSASSSESPSVSPSGSTSPSASTSPSPSGSVSSSESPSTSPSGSASASVSASTSPSGSLSYSASVSPSVSPSGSPSASVSPSVSKSTSPSVSASISPSGSSSPSASVSKSTSPSISPSGSASPSSSVSPSGSGSASPSGSVSPSVSKSNSPSVSKSTSPSVSPSGSLSPSGSYSASPSVSPSGSNSPSTSVSPSVSPSGSLSPSGSASPSKSTSASKSPSLSPSGSASPSGSSSPSASPSPSLAAGSANGAWTVTVIDANNFSLDGSDGRNDNTNLPGGWWTPLPLPAAYNGLQDGIAVKPGDPTRRLLGTIRTTSASLFEDSVLNRLVANLYNKIARPLRAADAAHPHTYNSATFRAWNNDAANAVAVVVCQLATVDLAINGLQASGNAGDYAQLGVGVDRVDGSDFPMFQNAGTASIGAGVQGSVDLNAGYHVLTAIEAATASTGTFTSYSLAGAVSS